MYMLLLKNVVMNSTLEFVMELVYEKLDII